MRATDSINRFTSYNAGFAAESKAKTFLIDNGLDFFTQNYKCKVGEIDLIFKKQQLWIFVEVKYRGNNASGYATEQVTRSKLRKITKAICWFMNEQNLNIHHEEIRIDLIAIDDNKLEWLKNLG